MILGAQLVVPGEELCPESAHNVQMGPLFASSDLAGLA